MKRAMEMPTALILSVVEKKADRSRVKQQADISLVINRGAVQQMILKAGRLAYLAGRIPRKMYATASSQVKGLVGC